MHESYILWFSGRDKQMTFLGWIDKELMDKRYLLGMDSEMRTI